MSKGSDLKVDYDLLSKSAKQLRQIRDEFNGLAEWKKDVKTLVGDSRVQTAMGDFVDNWDKNRKRLVKQIEEVGGDGQGDPRRLQGPRRRPGQGQQEEEAAHRAGTDR